jgi:hypothetical protein
MEPRVRGTAIDPRTSLAMWLRAGRAERKLTLDDVARVTKIQPRILEKIEAGNLDGLPADVFVRGFVKSFARCVGLNEIEAVERYGACSEWSGPTSSVARAFVETLVAAPKSAPTAPAVLEAPPPAQFPEASSAFEVSAPEIAHVIGSASPALQVAPVAAPAIEVVEMPVIEVVEAAEEIPAKKQKRSRKKAVGAPRTRKKKSEPELDASTAAPRSESSAVVDSAIKTTIESTLASVSKSGSVSESASVAASTASTASIEVIEKASASGSTSIVASTASIASIEVIEKASASGSTSVVAATASIEVVERTSGSASESGSAFVSAATASTAAVESVAFPPSMFDAPSTIIDTESATSDLFAPSDGIIIEHAEEAELASGSEPVVADPWQPTMPPPSVTSAPWKRPIYKTSAYTVPSLVIDDSDPEMADRERDDREAAAKPGPHRVSFLPPILLDREDKSSRQGGLTLAVILLLIAATLTLSYLMRRPSVSGDGVTQVEPRVIDVTSIVA